MDQFTTIAFHDNVETAWKLAREANGDDPSRALAALIYAAATHEEETDPEPDFLVSLYE
jgi:hypothetical protein